MNREKALKFITSNIDALNHSQLCHIGSLVNNETPQALLFKEHDTYINHERLSDKTISELEAYVSAQLASVTGVKKPVADDK